MSIMTTHHGDDERDAILTTYRDAVTVHGPDRIPHSLPRGWHSQLRALLDEKQTNLLWTETILTSQRQQIDLVHGPLHMRHRMQDNDRAGHALYAAETLASAAHRIGPDSQIQVDYHGVPITLTRPEQNMVRLQFDQDDFYLAPEMFTSTESTERTVMPLVEQSLDATYARLSSEREFIEADLAEVRHNTNNVRDGIGRLDDQTKIDPAHRATLAAAFPALPDPAASATATPPYRPQGPASTNQVPTRARRPHR